MGVVGEEEMSTLNQKFAQKATARAKEKKQSEYEESIDECLHEDIAQSDARNGRCRMCGATFDNMDEWE